MLSDAQAEQLSAARRSFIIATTVAMVNHGLWVPLIFLFFTLGRGLPLTGAGVAATVGNTGALLLGAVVAGRVVDRLGPFRAMTLSGVIGAAAFVGFLLTTTLGAVAAFSFTAALAGNLFFTSDPEAVRRLTAEGDDRTRMFALLTSVRVLGFGVGALAATLGLLFDRGSGWFWTALVAFIAAGELITAALFWRLRWVDDDGPVDGEPPDAVPPRYRDVLRQGGFMAFIAGVFIIGLTTIGMDTALPLFMLSVGLPTWTTTVAYLFICVMVAVAARAVARIGQRVPHLRILSWSTACCAVSFLVVDSLAGIQNAGPALLFAVLTLGLILFSVSDAASNALGANIMLTFAPAESSGRHGSLLQTAWAAASTVAPGMYAALFTAGRILPWLVSSVLLAVAAAVFAAVHGQRWE
ncbi:MFS transporter [Mycobacterium sp. pUA109]|uniref:MFS transporter n=1 Tax=Mycobacterium sp. pUA109 TaxID=3238982 RepID=UPI00351B20ED